MRKIFILVALLAFCITGANAQSMLRVHLSDNSHISIAVNGRFFDKEGQSITVGDLPPGHQHLKVYSLVANRRGRVHEEMVFDGMVRTKPGMITRFEYNPYTRGMDIQMEEINGRDPDRQPPINTQEDYRNSNTENNPPTNSNDNSIQPSTLLPPGAPAASPVPAEKTSSLTDEGREQLKAKADAKRTDTEKMAVLKDGLRNEHITTFDVSYMMDWFIFESSKVDFAAWAYNITIDREYYSDLLGKLNNKSSKDELDNFIKAKQ